MWEIFLIICTFYLHLILSYLSLILDFFHTFLGEFVMKFISLVLLVFVGLAINNSFSLITETYPSDRVLTGGNVSHHVSGTYGSHGPATTENGFFRSANANCAPSDDLCYSAHWQATTVKVTNYNLQGVPPPSVPYYCKTLTLDTNGFHLTVSPYPCGQ